MMGYPEPESFADEVAGLFLAGFAAFAPPLGTPTPLFVSSCAAHQHRTS